VPAVQVAAPFSVPAPVTDTLTVVLSPAAVPHAPPIEVTVALVRNGNVRATPFADVMLTTGAVLSTVMLCAPLVPVLPAVSDCVTVTVYVPFAEKAVVGVNVQADEVQVAVPLCVLAPVIETGRDVLTPAAVVQVPPNVVTVWFVEYGKVRAAPLTVVSVMVGAAVWIVIALAPDVPTLPAVSVCVAVTL
jgi:hypothetical protein